MSQASEKVSFSSPAMAQKLVQITIAFAAYFIAGKIGQATTNIRSGNLGPVWPAYGIALAVILLYGYRVWIGIAAAAFLIALWSPVPAIAAAGQAAGATIAALTGAFLLKRVNFQNSLARLHDALCFIVLGAFGSALVSASIGTAVLVATHLHSYSGIGAAWLIYWLGDSTGVLLITPLVLTFPGYLAAPFRERWAEFAFLLLLLISSSVLVFSDFFLTGLRLDVLSFALLAFVMWAAIRFGMCGTALVAFVIAALGTIETGLGAGAFSHNTPFINAVLLDVFFTVLAVSGMALAAVIAEREHARREGERLVREQAAMEVRLRLATIMESSDDAIIGLDLNRTITDWNKAAQRQYGYSPEEVIGRPVTDLIPAERGQNCVDMTRTVKQGYALRHYETVRRKKDGSQVEVSLTASPIYNSEGQVVGISSIERDVTERRKQEEALASTRRRLIDAQEDERRRIARELHDDIGQRLALLTVQLEQLRANSPDLSSEVRQHLDELRQQSVEMAADIQSLSHELHSARLEYLGIASAAEGYCREFAQTQKVEIDREIRELPRHIAPAVSLCLFRVLQEALQNSLKHSGVGHFEVRMWAAPDQIHLSVSDAGVGFDREKARQSHGLGLVSMEERVKLLDGKFSIESRPSGGTTIQASLPLDPEDISKRAVAGD